MAKAIINARRYDTDTAQQIYAWSNHDDTVNFTYCYEALYRTAKGSWFIDGHGGALSRYAQQNGDMRGSGHAIRPLTHDEAREWLEERRQAGLLEQPRAGVVSCTLWAALMSALPLYN